MRSRPGFWAPWLAMLLLLGPGEVVGQEQGKRAGEIGPGLELLFSPQAEGRLKAVAEMLPEEARRRLDGHLDRCRSLNDLERRLGAMVRQGIQLPLTYIDSVAGKMDSVQSAVPRDAGKPLNRLLRFEARSQEHSVSLTQEDNIFDRGSPFRRLTQELEVPFVRWIDLLELVHKLEKPTAGVFVSQVSFRTKYMKPNFANGKITASFLTMAEAGADVRTKYLDVELKRLLNGAATSGEVDGFKELCPAPNRFGIIPTPTAAQLANDILLRLADVWQDSAPFSLTSLRIDIDTNPSTRVRGNVELRYAVGSEPARERVEALLAAVPCLGEGVPRAAERMHMAPFKGWSRREVAYPIRCPEDFCPSAVESWCKGDKEVEIEPDGSTRKDRQSVLARLDASLVSLGQRWDKRQQAATRADLTVRSVKEGEDSQSKMGSDLVTRPPDPPAVPAVDYAAGVTVKGEGNYLIKKNMMEKACSDQEAVFAGARIIPNYDRKSGSYRGFKLIGVRPGSFFRAVGIRSGDVLLSYEDEVISSPSSLVKFMERFCTTEKMDILLLRRGKQMTLTYEFQ